MKDHAARQPQKTNDILSEYEFDVCNTLSNCLLLNVQQFSGFGPQNTISPVFWQLHDFPNIEALTFPNPLIIPTVNLTNGETLPYLIKGKSPHSCNIEKNLAKILKNIEKGKIGSDLCKHFLPHFSRTAEINKDHATLSKLCRKMVFLSKTKTVKLFQRLRAGEWKLETKREKWG